MPRIIGLFLYNFARFPFLAISGKILLLEYKSYWGFVTTGVSFIVQGLLSLFIWRPVVKMGYKTSLIVGSLLLVPWILAYLQATYVSYWNHCTGCRKTLDETDFFTNKEGSFTDVGIGALIGGVGGSIFWCVNSFKTIDDNRFGSWTLNYEVMLGALPAGMWTSALIVYLLPLDNYNNSDL